MDKKEVINGLISFRDRLKNEILNAYLERGSAFGNERFNTWKRKFKQFLNDNLPGEVNRLNIKLRQFDFVVLRNESPAERFWREYGEKITSYIDSLILDIENDEYVLPNEYSDQSTSKTSNTYINKNSVFIVHGHDGEAKERTARFIEKLGYRAIILHEQVSRGQTIIEKIERYSNVGFAIVLYTPDDLGNKRSDAEKGELRCRARQNVVFEHGYLMAKIGRENVVALVEGDIELPTDISGIVYIENANWQLDIAKEMKEAGYEIDFNSLLYCNDKS